MRCSDCCYYWKEEDELFPSCQWEARAPGEVPPCEEDDDYDEEDDGFLWIIGCAVVVGLIAAFATRSFLKNQLKSVAAGANANFYQTGDVTVTGSSDHFVGTTVSRTLIKKDDDSSGSSGTSSSGGFGGSSGRSF